MAKIENILFIPAPIKSHYIPSFYLSNSLSKIFTVYYLGNKTVYEDLVIKQGFHYIASDSLRFGIGLERIETEQENKKLPLLKRIKRFFKNDVYEKRKAELHQIIRRLKPSIIFIDIFSSTDFLLLYPYRSSIKMAFFNPMLSTYKVPGIPIMSEGNWPSEEKEEKNNFLKLFYKDKIFKYGLHSSFHLCKEYWKNKVFIHHKLRVDNPTVYTFDNVPEFILAPSELEFTKKMKKSYQHYLGLSITENRKETGVSKDFDDEFNEVLDKKKTHHKKLVYCSFGSYFYYLEEHKTVTSFLIALIEAFRQDTQTHFVVSANQYIKEALFRIMEVPEHFSVFTKVKQLEVLKHSEAFITHGGLGSIKEAINYEVPLLVYPLDMLWDQNGNAFKVEHHGIGLRGDILIDEPEVINTKLNKLLRNKIFKKNISALNKKIKEKYTSAYILSILSDVLKLPAECLTESEEEISFLENINQ